MTTALEGGEGSASHPDRSLPPGKTRYSLYRRLGGSQGRSGQVRKISPATGIRSPDRPARSQSLYRLRYPTHDLYSIPRIFGGAIRELSRKSQKRIVIGSSRLRLLKYGQLGNNVVVYVEGTKFVELEFSYRVAASQ
jgi:hypothetical protein